MQRWRHWVALALLAGQYASAADNGGARQRSDALIQKALVMRDQSGMRAAIPLFNTALVADPKNIDALLELAATQGDSGEARAMLATTRRILALDKNNPQAFYLQAVLAARDGQYDLARDLLYRTSPVLDQLPGPILLKGIVALQSGNNEEAISQLRVLLDMQPHNSRARQLIARAYAQAGDDDDVIATLTPLADRPDADSYTLTMIARAYENNDDRVVAARYLDRAALPIRGASTVFDPGQSLDVLTLADQQQPNMVATVTPLIEGLILNSQKDQALAKAQALSQANRDDPDAQIVAGDSFDVLGNSAQAVQAYRNASASRFDALVALRLINLFLRTGDIKGAEEVLRSSFKQNPTNPSMLSLRINQAMAEGQWQRASVLLEELRARLGNNDANMLNNLAWSWFNNGQPNKALVYARAAYALAPANPAVSNTYGWLLFQTGTDRQAGVSLLEKAVEISPSQAGFWLQLGEAYGASGHKVEARKILSAVAKNAAAPEHVLAARLLKQL